MMMMIDDDDDALFLSFLSITHCRLTPRLLGTPWISA